MYCVIGHTSLPAVLTQDFIQGIFETEQVWPYKRIKPWSAENFYLESYICGVVAVRDDKVKTTCI